MVTLELTRTFTPRWQRANSLHLGRYYSHQKREPPKSRSNHPIPSGTRGSAGLCRPRFSFFNIQFSKNRLRKRDVVGWFAFGSSPAECRSRGSLWFRPTLRNLEANFLVASSVAAVVGEAYIVGRHSKCQQRFWTFLNFLRRKFPSFFFTIFCRCGRCGPVWAARWAKPYCRLIAVGHRLGSSTPAICY